MAGRRSRTRTLCIWSNGVRVGTWRIPTRGDMELQYDPGWVASAPGRPLSLSLPFNLDNLPLKGEQVRSYFENLLPDSADIRRRLATRFKTASAEAFELLEAIGRDCVGAVQLLPPDQEPVGFDTIQGTALSNAEVAQYLGEAVATPLPGAGPPAEDDFRISLAGAQEKTALLWHGGWMRPHGATPTTHILKMPLGLVGNRKIDLSTSVYNEWLCLQVLREFGLPTAGCEIGRFGETDVLIVERFDRRMHPSGKWLMRLPQEDFCQALGVPPHLKYEADGGPGVHDICTLLRQSEDAFLDQSTVLAAQILFWMLAAPDGHAKNFSIRLLPGGRYRLTPLYDVVSIWPVVGDGPSHWSWHKAKMAMAVTGKNRHYFFKDIQRRHFNAMAAKCGYGSDADVLITGIIERVDDVIERVYSRLPNEFPARAAEAILGGLKQSAIRLADMPKD